jgi:hypothetical protein
LGRHLWRVSVRYRGVRTFDEGDARRRALKIDGTAYRVRGDDGERGEPRHFAMWLSNDTARVPLRVVGDASFGTLRFELVERESQAAVTAGCAATAARRSNRRLAVPTALP